MKKYLIFLLFTFPSLVFSQKPNLDVLDMFAGDASYEKCDSVITSLGYSIDYGYNYKGDYEGYNSEIRMEFSESNEIKSFSFKVYSKDEEDRDILIKKLRGVLEDSYGSMTDRDSCEMDSDDILTPIAYGEKNKVLFYIAKGRFMGKPNVTVYFSEKEQDIAEEDSGKSAPVAILIFIGIAVVVLLVVVLVSTPSKKKPKPLQPSANKRPNNQDEISMDVELLGEEQLDADNYQDRFYKTYIAGVSYYCKASDADLFVGFVTPQPNNPVDKDAIAVINNKGKLLGYIAKKEHDEFKEWSAGKTVPCVGYISVDEDGSLHSNLKCIRPYTAEFIQTEVKKYIDWWKENKE